MAKALRPGQLINRMFRAFSDRTRLRILAILQDGECCVGDLVQVLRVEQPSASRHLAYLRKAGLVVARKAGQWCYYSLAPASAAFHTKLLECLACCFNDVPEIRKDAARAEKVRSAGGCCPETGQATPSQREEPGGCCSLPDSALPGR